MAHPSLFPTAPAGRVRHTDPETSVAAARRAGGARTAILEAFRDHGPMTDDQLCDRLPTMYGPTVKTARSRLTGEGFLVSTGRTAPSRRRCEQIVWVLHHKLRQTETVADPEGRVA